MQVYFVPSEKLSLHDENEKLQKTNKELSDGIATRDEKIRELTVPDPQPLSWHEIEEGYTMRSGRGAEQIRFSREFLDKEVDWEVVLEFQIDKESWSFLYFENGSRFRPAALFAARFLTDSPVKDLKRGDRIKIHGKLGIFDGAQLEVQNATYDFLAPAPKSN